MKSLMILCVLCFSTLGFASKSNYVYPRVNVWPNGVDVVIFNSTDKDIRCSGTINIRTSKTYKTEFYFETIYRGMTSYRHFANFNPQERYLSAFHSIRCQAY